MKDKSSGTLSVEGKANIDGFNGHFFKAITKVHLKSLNQKLFSKIKRF